jgi:asparagine synthase (glutamine-hydrolysing)
MCGIVGICGVVSESDRQWLRDGRDALKHRGPDSAGEWWSSDGRVGFGHRRLAIIDLSPLGSQPMHFLERGLSIVFNGEIYNHKALRLELAGLGFIFRSHSDTEVLLAAYAAWGSNCLERLNGMFAFAIYDEPQRKLILARDRAGEKPLFYHLKNGCLQFASELKALLAHAQLSKNIDPEALDCYLSMGFVPGDRCILRGYKKLPPAHAMLFNLKNGMTKIWRYWDLSEIDIDDEHTSEVDLLDELEILLEQAVGIQMVADVPVGILLSGGIDSSLITAMAVRHSSKVHTYSVGFPGYGKFDETPHARLIARHFETEHTELIAEPTSAELLPMLARQFDEPIVDSSMFPTYLVSHMIRKHCTVALGGDGGDELFGGYNHYSRLLWMQRKFAYLPRSIRRVIAQSAEQLLPVGLKGRNYLQSLNVNLQEGLPLIASYFDATQRRKLLHGYLGYDTLAEIIRSSHIPQHTDLLQRATRMDFQNYLAEDILVKVDRASMINSLEIRSPYLDHKLIEFAFKKVPSCLKATESEKKILLKKLAARVLPPEFDKHRKQGFAIPLTEWLKRGPFREVFWDTLTSKDCIFDSKAVHNLLKGQDRGHRNEERLFALVQFELWRKIYKVSI